MSAATDWANYGQAYSGNMHMFGHSGTNYERYPQGALYADGSGCNMGKAYNYLHTEFRHGANPPVKLNPIISKTYLGQIGADESGSGIANMLVADGSVTNFNVTNRVQTMDDRVKAVKISANDDTHKSICDSECAL